MEAHRIETTVQPHGRVVLENLPFEEGEKVEIIVMEAHEEGENPENPLRGTLLKYDDPFEPAVPPEDWEALK
ncbi:MAG TPA: hypothetical protein VL327_10825 [Pyrinomonadaceae bacterium]|jgi:hypothetical protein|nr:hypothetical protein [Pyrinomonadaceae bacterium]